jgi:hypothetical protein
MVAPELPFRSGMIQRVIDTATLTVFSMLYGWAVALLRFRKPLFEQVDGFARGRDVGVLRAQRYSRSMKPLLSSSVMMLES